MSHIVEARINGRERIYRVSDVSGIEIKALWGTKSRERPKTIVVKNEEVQTDCILLVSPEATWREHDDKAQSERGKQRCTHCLTVRPLGESCMCPEASLYKAGLIQHPQGDRAPLTDAQITRGMIRAINIALTYPGVTYRSPFIIGYMRRHGIKFADLQREAKK